MMDALWAEIQTRYGFTAPNALQPDGFAGDRAAFWIALAGTQPVGSIALAPLSETEAELDVMYVSPSHRGTGVARQLMATMETHAVKNNFTLIKLRAGAPQPEALRFYAKAGFTPTKPFGKWANDDTALCFEKILQVSPRP